jgi:predicted N-acyltransferase
VQTISAHHIVDPSFRHAVADFLTRERAGVAQDQQFLGQHTPFRREPD